MELISYVFYSLKTRYTYKTAGEVIFYILGFSVLESRQDKSSLRNEY